MIDFNECYLISEVISSPWDVKRQFSLATSFPTWLMLLSGCHRNIGLVECQVWTRFGNIKWHDWKSWERNCSVVFLLVSEAFVHLELDKYDKLIEKNNNIWLFCYGGQFLKFLLPFTFFLMGVVSSRMTPPTIIGIDEDRNEGNHRL